MLNDAPVPGGPTPTKDVTTASFRQDVIAESMQQPVLVDFWAPWCGPCKQLAPVLEKVVAGSAGKVKLVKMNIDEHPSIAGQLGIQSIPAVIAFDKGQPVDGFMGAVPEAQIKDFITRLAGPAGPTPIEEALSEAEALLGVGDVAQAAQLYAAVLAEEPANVDAIAALAKIQLDAGDIENAKELVAMAPPETASHAGLASVRAAIELAEQAAALGDLGTFQARIEADPNDFQARFDLALGLNGRNLRDEAVDQLIEIERRDRTWNEGAARKQLLTFFEAWGLMDKASIRGRRRLSSLVFA
ncbi:thioredoxin [Methylobacterium sp. Leaf88]|jgi:putative thioredoxin|uniref:thioredoxin n=1 Tax=Methylobacterium sp. Leaf88 TaxID=1736244 RepID=UPI0007022656|nr:thioredoxin [Methylobacterium sp. Leaf88]KQO69957.1 thioredoxin [Methylobacterium sp. Leaf88]